MREINKVDYFCGAFLSYLISNGVEPTLFEAGEKAKSLNLRFVILFIRFSSSTPQRKKQ